MKVLSVNKFFWNKGGSETVFFQEMGLLESRGHKVVPFSMKSDNNLPSEYSTYFIEWVDYSSRNFSRKISNAIKIIYSFEARKKIGRLLEVEDVDIAHLHIFQHQISPSIFSELKSRGIPIICTLHDLKPLCPNYTMYTNGGVCEACKGGKFYNAVANRCTKNSLFGSLVNAVEMYFHEFMGYYRQVDCFIAVSQFYRQKMIEFGYPEEKIVYLPNAVNVGEFEVSLEISDYILFFGRLSEEKGIETLLFAARENPDIQHVIAGDGPLREELEETIVELGICNVKMVGFKSGAELRELVAKAIAVIVPSVWYENCPMTVLEAFASGRPVIGSDIGGITELIQHNFDGFLFPPKDADALASHIRNLVADPVMASEFGARGRKKVAAKYCEDTHAERLLEIYSRAVISA